MARKASKDREPGDLSPQSGPDRPAHLSIQIPVSNRSFVKHSETRVNGPLFATLLDSALVAIDAK